MQVAKTERKGAILTHPLLPCLSRFHTINLTAGCSYDCRYCYTKSFRSNPGKGRLVFYTNSQAKLLKELPRKKKKPVMVYFSTSCEPFLPIPAVLRQLYGMMEQLLENGIHLLISTKSKIPKQFGALFAKYPGQVHVQVGLTTVDDRVRQALEPYAADVSSRLANFVLLREIGATVEVRMDPLIPHLTDTDESLSTLLGAVSKQGCDRAVASYLFLRRSNRRSMTIRIGEWDANKVFPQLYTKTVKRYCSNNDIQVPALEYRKSRINYLEDLGKEFGISIGSCACKNPDLTINCCHPQPTEATDRQVRLL